MARRYGRGDVQFFERFGWVYDLATNPVPPVSLDPALVFAERPIDRVLDIAGGTGRATEPLLDTAEIVPVIDAASTMCRRARLHGRISIRGDVENFPVRDDAVDAVVIGDALHHLPTVSHFFDEAARVLAPGGVLLIEEIDPSTVIGNLIAAGEDLIGFDSRFFTPERLCTMLTDAGFEPRIAVSGVRYLVAGRVSVH
jgi:demethylmenaquinone methyltransferase/2-methoxy-6-polyprenyl-1,4-benzoquinol methylase